MRDGVCPAVRREEATDFDCAFETQLNSESEVWTGRVTNCRGHTQGRCPCVRSARANSPPRTLHRGPCTESVVCPGGRATGLTITRIVFLFERGWVPEQ